MSFVNAADDRLTCVDAFDVASVTVFSDMYTSGYRLADEQNPTMDELLETKPSFLRHA